MRFKKLFGSGLDKDRRDPRDKIWAEFECTICNNNTDIDVTSTMKTFQFERERKCPHCGNTNPEDKITNLKYQLEKLTEDKSRINIEIERITRELEEFKVNAN